MKKAFFVVLLLLTVIITRSQAPGDDKKDTWKDKKLKAWFDAYMGGVMSSIPGDDESMDGSLAGLQLGIRMNVIMLSDRLGVNAEANFTQQGGKYTIPPYTGEPGGGDPGMPGREGKLRLNYINFPITTSYQSEGGFIAEAGLQPGLLISAKDKIDGNTTDVKDGFNEFDVGLVAGVGYQFKNRIGVGFRAVPGLTNINKKVTGAEVGKARNFVLSLRASYSF